MFDLKNQIILNDVVYAWPPFHKLDGINPFLVVLLIISLWQMEWWWNWFIPQTKHTNSHPPTVRSNNEFNLNCTQKKNYCPPMKTFWSSTVLPWCSSSTCNSACAHPRQAQHPSWIPSTTGPASCSSRPSFNGCVNSESAGTCALLAGWHFDWFNGRTWLPAIDAAETETVPSRHCRWIRWAGRYYCSGPRSCNGCMHVLFRRALRPLFVVVVV